jgi:hypothetical protein
VLQVLLVLTALCIHLPVDADDLTDVLAQAKPAAQRLPTLSAPCRLSCSRSRAAAASRMLALVSLLDISLRPRAALEHTS